MSIVWADAVLLGVLSATIHWLIARSKIAQPLWSRARGWIATLLACPACSGFWIGAALTATGIVAAPPWFLGPPDTTVFTAGAILTNGLLAVFLTPVCEGILMWGFGMSAIESDEPDDV